MDDTIFILICIIAILAAILPLARLFDAKNLKSKFSSLGNLRGKSYYQISSKVGAPQSISRQVLDDGSTVTIRQWLNNGYHIVLLFDERDICLGISSETHV